MLSSASISSDSALPCVISRLPELASSTAVTPLISRVSVSTLPEPVTPVKVLVKVAGRQPASAMDETTSAPKAIWIRNYLKNPLRLYDFCADGV